jgi:hypothetical protein
MPEYILYLQPKRSSSLYKSVTAFYSLSLEKLGPNEAHLYHPHVSITGFWQTDTPVDSEFLKALETILPLDVQIAVQPPFQEKTLILPIQSGPKLKALPHLLQSLPHPESASIRPKRVDHLSLAYGQGYDPQNPAYLSLAHTVFEDLEGLNCTEWEIIFLEREFKSLNSNQGNGNGLIEPHRFKEIQKWGIVSSQLES